MRLWSARKWHVARRALASRISGCFGETHLLPLLLIKACLAKVRRLWHLDAKPRSTGLSQVEIYQTTTPVDGLAREAIPRNSHMHAAVRFLCAWAVAVRRAEAVENRLPDRCGLRGGLRPRRTHPPSGPPSSRAGYLPAP